MGEEERAEDRDEGPVPNDDPDPGLESDRGDVTVGSIDVEDTDDEDFDPTKKSQGSSDDDDDDDEGETSVDGDDEDEDGDEQDDDDEQEDDDSDDDMEEREMDADEVADIEAKPQSPSSMMFATQPDADLVEGLPDVSEAEMEELFDSDVTETDDDSEKEEDDDDDPDEEEEEEDAQQRVDERADDVATELQPSAEDDARAASSPPRRHDGPGDMAASLTPIHPAFRPEEEHAPSSSDPLVVGQKRRLLGSLASDDEGEDAGPAKRTRANLSLVDIDFDFIERMLPLPDEDAFGEYGEYDDKEEWSNFLSAISLDFQVPEEEDAGARADDEGGAPAGFAGDEEDDEDDEDYAVVDPKAARVERRLALATLPPAARRKTKRRKTKYVYRPKSERPQYRERPIYSFTRARSARQAAERKRRTAEEAVAAATGTTGTNDPPEATKGIDRPPARPLAPSIPRGDFTPTQVSALHKMIHDHVQLLLQTYARTAWNQTPAAQLVARRTRGLIEQLVQDTKQRLIMKVQSKALPYPTGWFASPHVARRTVPETQPAVKPRAEHTGSVDATKWWPKVNHSVFTVLDVAPLRDAHRFIQGVEKAGMYLPVPAGLRVPPPPTMVEAANSADPAAANAAREDAQRVISATESIFGRLSELFREEGEGSTKPSASALGWGSADTDTGEGGKGKSRTRRKPPPNEIVPFYVRVPRSVVAVSRPLAPKFNPNLLPRVPHVKIASDDFNHRWLPAEDELLATGILNYGINWELIHRTLLPTKTVKQITQRQKNLCNSTRFKGDNSVKSAKQRVMRPLAAHEIATIQEALFRDGARSGAEDWHRLCSRFLPTRHPSCLERLWREAHPEGPPTSHGGQASYLTGKTDASNDAKDAGEQRPSAVASINMIHSSLHDNDTTGALGAPRQPRIGAVDARTGSDGALLHPSLLVRGEEEEEMDRDDRDEDAAAAEGVRTGSDVVPDVSGRAFGDDEATREGLAEAALSGMLFASEASREAPDIMFEREEMMDSEDEEDDGGGSRGGGGADRGGAVRRKRRNSGMLRLASAAVGEKRDRAEREALSSDEDEDDGLEREEILSDSESEGAAEQSELEDSASEGVGAVDATVEDANKPDVTSRLPAPPQQPPPQQGGARPVILASLDTNPPPDVGVVPGAQGAAPTTMTGIVASINAAGNNPQQFSSREPLRPVSHAWTRDQDHAILMAAQRSGPKLETWTSLVAAGGGCMDVTSEQVAERFTWLCERAKTQKCSKPQTYNRRKPQTTD